MSGPYHPTGRAKVSSRSPSAQAVCDRCGFTYQRNKLKAQQQWAGMMLQTYNILVCQRCWDVPQIQLKTIIIPADPSPVLNPRPEQYTVEVPSYMSTITGLNFITDTGLNLIMEIEVTPSPNPDNPVLFPP